MPRRLLSEPHQQHRADREVRGDDHAHGRVAPGVVDLESRGADDHVHIVRDAPGDVIRGVHRRGEIDQHADVCVADRIEALDEHEPRVVTLEADRLPERGPGSRVGNGGGERQLGVGRDRPADLASHAAGGPGDPDTDHATAPWPRAPRNADARTGRAP